MATVLDMGLFKSFSGIFPFLFVLVMMWAVLLRVKFLSENKAFAAMIAFLLAVAGMFSPVLVKTINLMAPWFVLLFMVIVFVMIVYQAFGIKEESILKLLTESAYSSDFFWTMIAIIGMIVLGSLFTVLSEEKVEFRAGANVAEAEMTPAQWGIHTLSNPKVLGFMVVMLIAMFTVQQLLEKQK